MTNQSNTSQNRPFQRDQLKREVVDKLVEASPFRKLLKLPPEEVLDLFRSRAGQALLEGLLEWKHREAEGLLSDALHIAHDDAGDKLYVAAGIAEVVDKVVALPDEVKRFIDASKQRRS